jgi:suppressor of ftsI
MDVRWRFRLGEVAKIRIANDRAAAHPMPHPIHLHGQRFLVLSHNGVPTPNLVWKDTVLLPVGDVVDVLVEMSNPGVWMMHCHIAEHLQSGMMGLFEVR